MMHVFKEYITKKHGLPVLCLLMVIGLWSLLLFPWPADAADSSLCARVKIEIKQKLTLERQAFDAHMAINNGLANVTIEKIKVDVRFTDKDGNAVLVSSDPNNTKALFYIRLDSMNNITDVAGAGTVAPSSTADVHWLIIPAPGASNNLESGALYYVGATISYTIGGQANVTEVSPDYIYVKPMPSLTLDYFLPNDVYADDAFTAEIEPPVPFSLGVRVKNNGAGVARSLKIESAQPKIVENNQGLLIGFNIEATEVNGTVVANSLLADFGDVAPQSSVLARWIMTTTLSGNFVEFSGNFSHLDELGGTLTSLITAVNTHFLVHDVLVDLPGRDGIRDFLARDGGVYRVYESEGLVDTEVTDQSASSVLSGQTLTTPVTAGFIYATVTDPYGGGKIIKEVIRSDGKRINLNNVWFSKKRTGGGPWQYFFNLFDTNGTGSYTVTFADPATGPRAPVLQFIPDRTGKELQQLSFIVEATDPDGTIPVLSAAPLPAKATFRDQGNGTAIFDWTPATGQTGQYPITFTASDGVLKTSQRATITIGNGGNNPPNMPSAPSPQDGKSGVSVKARLAWAGGDPDQGDTVAYDVYLGTANPPSVKVASGLPATVYSTSILTYGATYYWKVVARDKQGAETAGPVWRFTTFLANDDADNDGLKNQKEIELGKDPFTPDNERPIADAGTNQTAALGQTVKLDGSASRDPEGLEITFQWTFVEKPAGSGVAISNGTNAIATFTADVAGSYTLQLVVNDGYQDSLPVQIIVATASTPVADAGPSRNVIKGQVAVLDGSESYDPEGSMITFQWSFVEIPAGSAVTDASLSDRASPKPTFTPDVNGVYKVQLVVANKDAESPADEVSITAASPDVPPNAEAGPDQYAKAGSVVNLDGSGSYDPDKAPQALLSYLWSFTSQPNGSLLTDNDITARTTDKPGFTPQMDGPYDLKLTVSDGTYSSDDAVRVTASGTNIPPNARAGIDLMIRLGSEAVLDGTGSNDPDSDLQTLTYVWTFVHVPAESVLTNGDIVNASTAAPSFIPDVAGAYILQLAVSDGSNVSFDNVAVTAKPVRISGAAVVYPQAPYLASFTLDITGLVSPTGSLKYYYSKTRMTFVATSISSVSISGKDITIVGNGTINGTGTYGFTTTIADANPDSIAIVIKKTDGSTYFSTGPLAVSKGNVLVYP